MTSTLLHTQPEARAVFDALEDVCLEPDLSSCPNSFGPAFSELSTEAFEDLYAGSLLCRTVRSELCQAPVPRPRAGRRLRARLRRRAGRIRGARAA